MTIFKYPIAVTDIQQVDMPKGATVLCVQAQRDQPFLWALVDASAQMEPRTFRVVGTGHPANDVEYHPYVGTFQLLDGSLVFHVFEVVA